MLGSGLATATWVATGRSRSSRRPGVTIAPTPRRPRRCSSRAPNTDGGCGFALSKVRRVPKLLGLRCRECGAEDGLQAAHVCEMCFGPLDAVYDKAVLKKIVSRQRIEQGPKSMWRYRDLLPVEDSVSVVTLGEGFTPLVKADRLGAELGLRNPNWRNTSLTRTTPSRDRAVEFAISGAGRTGFETIA